MAKQRIKKRLKKPYVPGAPVQASVNLDPAFPIGGSAPTTISNRAIDFLHIHDVFEIGLCLEGKGIFVIEEKVFPFAPGDVFIINHLELHRACLPEGGQSRWYFFMTDPALLLAGAVSPDPAVADTTRLSGSTFPNRFPASAFPKINALVSDLAVELRMKRKYFKTGVRSLVALLLVELNRFRIEKSPPTVSDKRSLTLMSRLSPALLFIAKAYGENLTTADLAGQCCMGEGHFRRLFHCVFRKGPLDYLNDYRISMICSLLSTTDRSVSSIALDCGFPTLSCFNRQFRRRKGCSPREWRKRENAADVS